jgi:hypothetical protein
MMNQSSSPIVFIGDRPALQCALVVGASLTFVNDRLDPFQVYQRIEDYVSQLEWLAHDASGRVAPGHPDRILLSTGLMWSSRRDDHIISKQIRALLIGSLIAPRIYVLGVSSRVATGHNINARIEVAARPRSRSSVYHQYVRFVGGFAACAAYPTEPTPGEVLRIMEIVEAG